MIPKDPDSLDRLVREMERLASSSALSDFMADWKPPVSETYDGVFVDIAKSSVMGGRPTAKRTATFKTGAKTAAATPEEEEKSRRVAAAATLAREVELAWAEQEIVGGYDVQVVPFSYTFTVMTGDGYRKLPLHLGHRMQWNGKVRAGATGKLIFTFEPELDAELRKREATAVEVPHDELAAAFGRGLVDWLEEAMGGSLDDLLRGVKGKVTREEVADAARVRDEPEPLPDEASVMPNWGAWA